MKRSSLFLTLVMTVLLSFGLAYGQPDGGMYISDLTGDFGTGSGGIGDTVISGGVAITWTLNLFNNNGEEVVASVNGFRIYSPDGATWPVNALLDTLPGPYSNAYTSANVTPVNLAGANEAAGDTCGIGGFDTRFPAVGFADGFDAPVVTITLSGGVNGADGSHVCLDSSGYNVNTEWLWGLTSGSGGVSNWGPPGNPYGGPQCYTLYQVPNQCPTFGDCAGGGACPPSLGGDHCALSTYDFDACDAEEDAYTFSLNSGPGSIDANSGVWSYQPSLADVGASLNIEVAVSDGICGGETVCQVPLNYTNECPTFTDGCGDLVAVGKGNSANLDFDAVSNDCDPISYHIIGVNPAPTGSYSIDPSTGVLTFNTDEADGGSVYCFEVGVTDGACTTSCEGCFDVLVTEPFRVEIEKTHNTLQGGHELVCVSLTAGSEDMWGFDILIAYDQSALSLVAALEGEIYDICGWEYFNYRYGANGNCNGGCPSGLVRVVGLAETNNGSNHPSCYSPPNLPVTLFCLDFLVSNDRTFECQYVPVRFFWVDCGDNTISFNPADDPTGFEQRLAISRDVFDFDLIGNIANPNVGYPTYQGAQDSDCFPPDADPDKPAPVRFIDFVNGGVDIVCADSIDARGDVNLNNFPNEVADAVLFTNYFIYGIGVFTVNVAGQVAATDVNADGLTLTVADLVYLIRIVIGDVAPFPKLAPVEAILTLNSKGTLNISDVEVGAAAVVLSGNVEPTLLASNMKLEYAYDESANVTRALVYSMEANQSFTGDFLNVGSADVVNVEMATFEGAEIVAKEVELPTDFALNQNYPNPFNPTTVISFALPTASDYTLTIYNVTGQKVSEFSGSAEAGVVEFSWDAAKHASGVYFYKLVAEGLEGTFTDTKKMVLVR